MANVTPVFCFNGGCEDAIKLYERAFGASTKQLLRYSDARREDFDAPLTDAERNMIYHAEVYIGDQRVMMSDYLEFSFIRGTSLFLTVTYNSPDDVKRAYEVLKEEGTVIYPLRSTTYSSCMVTLVDRFGFQWGIMTETT